MFTFFFPPLLGAGFGYSVAISNSNAYLGIGEPGFQPPSVVGYVYTYSSPSGGPYNLFNTTFGSTNLYGSSSKFFFNQFFVLSKIDFFFFFFCNKSKLVCMEMPFQNTD